MKLRLAFILLLVSVFCFGQITFNKYFTTSFTDLGCTHVFNEPDSSITFFSYSKAVAGGLQDFTAGRVNKLGNLTIVKNYTVRNQDFGAYLDGLKQFIPISSTSYLATGANSGANSTNLLFCKINRQTLDTVFTKLFNDNVNNYYLNSFIKISSNKYFLIGGMANSVTQQGSSVILHIDTNLNIVNTLTLNSNSQFYTNNAVLHPTTKKLLIGGTIVYNPNNTNVSFIEADTFGVVTNSMIIPYADIQGISQLKYSAFDNTYVFGGGIRTSKVGNTSFYRLQFTKLNTSNLNVVWSKTYGQSCLLNNFNTITVNPDGSIVGCGRYADSVLNQGQWDAAGVLLKVGVNGDSLWIRRYNNYQNPPNPSNYFETFFGLERSLDGGYIACGGIMNQPQGKAWIIKTDSNGCVQTGCGSIINGTYTATTDVNENAFLEDGFSVFPNPAKDKLTITYDAPKAENVEAELMNALGQVVFKAHLQGKLTSIDIQDLPSGLYVLSLNYAGYQKRVRVIKE